MILSGAVASSGVGFPVVSGGTLYSDSVDYYRLFTSSDTLQISGAPLSLSLEWIWSGGGGGGRSPAGGGGGGCGQSTYGGGSQTLTPGSYPIIIGAGGAAGLSGNGGTGGQTSALGITVTGGPGGNATGTNLSGGQTGTSAGVGTVYSNPAVAVGGGGSGLESQGFDGGWYFGNFGFTIYGGLGGTGYSASIAPGLDIIVGAGGGGSAIDREYYNYTDPGDNGGLPQRAFLSRRSGGRGSSFDFYGTSVNARNALSLFQGATDGGSFFSGGGGGASTHQNTFTAGSGSSGFVIIKYARSLVGG